MRRTITGPSECCEFYFLTKFLKNIFNEHDKINFYSPSLHQDSYQKLFKCSNNYTPTNIIPTFLNEEVIDFVIDEIVKDKDFEESETGIET